MRVKINQIEILNPQRQPESRRNSRIGPRTGLASVDFIAKKKEELFNNRMMTFDDPNALNFVQQKEINIKIIQKTLPAINKLADKK